MERKQTRNPADRAIARIRAAVGRLALLLGDEDPATADAAAMALGAIDPFAVGPLAAALPRGPSPRHRAAIVAALLTFGEQEKAAVARALRGALERDPDPHVRVAAQAALTRLLLGDLVSKPSATPYGSRIGAGRVHRKATRVRH
jgi:HEAT repeat protein